MSAGGYDGPHMPPAFSRFEPRRSSGQLPATFDRPTHALPSRPAPSPSSSRRPNESFARSRPEGFFRDNAPNVYRPNSYRPDYSGTYYSRSPSPDAYVAPSRSADDMWDRGAHSWRPPSIEPPTAPWADRKPLPPSPPTSARGRSQRDDIPSRTFEPSDTWKQTHVDRPARPDHSPPVDRYFDRRPRGSMDASPERPLIRMDRPLPFMSGGDRYRPPPPKREGFLAGRPDLYRPQYDNIRTPIRRDPISPSTSAHLRRDSGSITRTSSRHDSPHTARTLSRKGSRSPHSVVSTSHTPSHPAPDSDNWAYPASVKEDVSFRPLSRSSIASTQVSESQIFPPPPIPEPSVPERPKSPAATVKQITKPPKPVVDIVPEPSKKVEALNPEPPKPSKPPNGTVSLEKPPTQLSTEKDTQLPPDSVASSEKAKKPAAETPVPTVLDIVKESSTSMTPPVLPVEVEILEKTPTKDVQVNGTSKPTPAVKEPAKPVPVPDVVAPPSPPPAPPTPPPTAAITPAPVTPAPAPIPQPPSKDVTAPEIVQPKPSYQPPSPKDTNIDVEIPPTTHSPAADIESLPPPTPVPIPVIPVVRQKSFPTPEEIPTFSDMTTKEEALRIAVMSRLLQNHVTREQRVNHVLMQNMAIAAPLEVHPTATPDSLLDRMFSGQEMEERMASFIRTRPKLALYLGQRHGMIDAKITRLREEYRSLQESWIAHCNALNEQQKALATEHEAQHTGRTTRRSTAITDAVRSDFEMEQIIASLGVDDATDPNHLSVRNVAKIPDMICVTNGQVDYLFDDRSHRVDNPKEYYAPVRGTEDWKEEEKTIFLEKFAAHPKQFGIIADYLPNKTAAQCVNFYYLHKHNFIDFRKVVAQLAPNKRKRRGVGKKKEKGNGLLVDIALHDMEVSRGATAATTTVSAPPARRGRKAGKRNAVQFEDTPTSTPTPEPESVAPTRGRRRKTVATTTSLATSTTAASISVSVSDPPSAAPSAPPSAAGSVPPSKPPSVAAPSVPPSAPPSALPSAPPSAPPSTVIPPAVPKEIDPPPPPPLPPVSISLPPPVSAPANFHIPVREVVWPSEEPEHRPTKKAKRTRRIKSAATVPDDPPSPGAETTEKPLPWLTPTGANGGPSDLSYYGSMKPPPPPTPSQWSEDDKKLFISLLSQHGDNFKRIAASMPNKTTVQVSNYFWNHRVDLGLAEIAAKAPRRSRSPDSWNESMAAGLAAHARGPNSPMSALVYDTQSMFRPPPSTYPETRHIMSESVPPHSAPTSAARAHQQQQTYERMSHVLAPPMARLGSSNTPSARPILYNGATSPYPFSSPTDPREGYAAGKYVEAAGRSYMTTSAPMPPGVYYAYPPTARPPIGYPPSGSMAAPGTAPIIHSPTGLSSPAKLPMQPLHAHGYPPDDPHASYYAQAQARARADSRGSQQWDAQQPYVYRDGRRENTYPTFNSTPSASASTPASASSAGEKQS